MNRKGFWMVPKHTQEEIDRALRPVVQPTSVAGQELADVALGVMKKLPYSSYKFEPLSHLMAPHDELDGTFVLFNRHTKIYRLVVVVYSNKTVEVPVWGRVESNELKITRFGGEIKPTDAKEALAQKAREYIHAQLS